MYVLYVDGYPHRYDPRDRTRTPFTLVSAMRAAYGCAGVHVARADGTMVVRNAGRAFTDLTHAPTGRVLRRRLRRYPVPATPCPFPFPHDASSRYCRCG